ncbi:hypothetical protein pb186bvf_006168 [Paramecium bursaria]
MIRHLWISLRQLSVCPGLIQIKQYVFRFHKEWDIICLANDNENCSDINIWGIRVVTYKIRHTILV